MGSMDCSVAAGSQVRRSLPDPGRALARDGDDPDADENHPVDLLPRPVSHP